MQELPYELELTQPGLEERLKDCTGLSWSPGNPGVCVCLGLPTGVLDVCTSASPIMTWTGP